MIFCHALDGKYFLENIMIKFYTWIIPYSTHTRFLLEIHHALEHEIIYNFTLAFEMLIQYNQ
jgi:hypothetical protein